MPVRRWSLPRPGKIPYVPARSLFSRGGLSMSASPVPHHLLSLAPIPLALSPLHRIRRGRAPGGRRAMCGTQGGEPWVRQVKLV